MAFDIKIKGLNPVAIKWRKSLILNVEARLEPTQFSVNLLQMVARDKYYNLFVHNFSDED
jgi:hypothetical protein